MIYITKNKKDAYGVKTFFLDTNADVANLPKNCAPGSKALVISNGNRYRMDNDKNWVKQPQESGGGGGGGSWSEITDKPFDTIGEGLMVDDDALTYNPEVISTVDYVDANITDTMNFIIQERDAEHAGRVAGDNLLHNEVERVEAKVDEKMLLVDGTKPFVDWNGAVGTNPTITITNGDDTFTLCRVNPKIITDIIPSADGKTIQGFSYVEVVNGEEQEHTGSGWISGTDIYGGGNHVIGGHTTNANIVLLSGAAGTYNITLGNATVPFTIPSRGTYVIYTDNNNYLKIITISGSTDSKIEQNGEDITEATADVLSEFLATQAERADLQTQITNLGLQFQSFITSQTTAPIADITDGGIHLVYLNAEPTTKYNGYIYLIKEA